MPFCTIPKSMDKNTDQEPLISTSAVSSWKKNLPFEGPHRRLARRTPGTFKVRTVFLLINDILTPSNRFLRGHIDPHLLAGDIHMYLLLTPCAVVSSHFLNKIPSSVLLNSWKK